MIRGIPTVHTGDKIGTVTGKNTDCKLTPIWANRCVDSGIEWNICKPIH